MPAADLPLLRLFQLASPTLPVGAYSYSQGLEWAVAAGWVSDEGSLEFWLREQLVHSIGGVDLPILARLYDAVARGDDAAQVSWSEQLVALRETEELVADDCARGRALARLLRDLGIAGAAAWLERERVPFAAPSALAAVTWEIPSPACGYAYAWGWLENQVIAGVKLVPLGQVAGQRLLLRLAEQVPEVCAQALERRDDEIGGMLPIVAIASSRHETQYTRLFRS